MRTARYYFWFHNTKCYYHYKFGLDAFRTGHGCNDVKRNSLVQRTHLRDPRLSVFSLYILMQHPQATDTELFFAMRNYNSLGHLEKPLAANGPLPSTLSLHCPLRAPWEHVLNDERHQTNTEVLIPAAVLLRACTLLCLLVSQYVWSTMLFAPKEVSAAGQPSFQVQEGPEQVSEIKPNMRALFYNSSANHTPASIIP